MVCLVLVVFCFFLSSPDIIVIFTPNAETIAHSKTRHQAQHTCSSAPRHRYRRPTGAASPPRIPIGVFKQTSSGQQPAAQPLLCAAKNSSYELLAHSKPLSSYCHDSVPEGGNGYGGALSAVRAQCNYLGVWTY